MKLLGHAVSVAAISGLLLSQASSQTVTPNVMNGCILLAQTSLRDASAMPDSNACAQFKKMLDRLPELEGDRSPRLTYCMSSAGAMWVRSPGIEKVLPPSSEDRQNWYIACAMIMFDQTKEDTEANFKRIREKFPNWQP